ncbi:hypothetical protein INN71_02700 [Nocardioides sp. ChNu-153]|nr:hypothetical protein [Nocardioides sp. ChNu-153]MDN7120295.1 hypothetical protein [Nocardioides sp. ChNu-153]
MDPASTSWEDQYQQEVAGPALALIAGAQVLAARESDVYVADVLNELAFGPRTEPGVLRPEAFTGVSGDGLPTGGLLEQAVAHAGQRYNDLRRTDLSETLTVTRGPDIVLARQALDDTQDYIDGLVETILADTARAADEAAMAQRPWVTGWVRMAEPGACSRCIVLTGRFYLFNEGFERHPRCRCTHLPAPDNRTAAGRETLDRLMAVESPDSHFAALTETEQDRVFGAAGAQAIRDGADISRVVNARRGMRRAQVAGRSVLLTTEATTRRGRTPGQTRGPRLMPESILALAGDDPAERIRLLRLHGYIT